jgi:hypothetical protein
MRCTYEVHAREVHARETHAHEVHAREIHAHEVHACEMHVYEVHTHEVHACEVHAREVYGQCTTPRTTLAQWSEAVQPASIFLMCDRLHAFLITHWHMTFKLLD